MKFYRSAAGDPEDRVTNVRKVRRHYDFVVIGDSSSERMEEIMENSDSINIGCLNIKDKLVCTGGGSAGAVVANRLSEVSGLSQNQSIH